MRRRRLAPAPSPKVVQDALEHKRRDAVETDADERVGVLGNEVREEVVRELVGEREVLDRFVLLVLAEEEPAEESRQTSEASVENTHRLAVREEDSGGVVVRAKGGNVLHLEGRHIVAGWEGGAEHKGLHVRPSCGREEGGVELRRGREGAALRLASRHR